MTRELESNPSLVNDPHYVQNEPDLGIYLSHHPDIKAQLQRNPNDLLRAGNVANDANRGGNPSVNAPPNSAGAELMNEYLDQHKDVDQQLKQNPALIDDANFLGQHQDLRTLLNNHPQIRAQFERDPAYFTRRQWRLEAAATNDGAETANDNSHSVSPANVNSAPRNASPVEASPANRGGGNVAPVENMEVRPQDVARLQQFFEDHADIARHLEARPTLVTDYKYLDKHKDLRRFFYEHVQLREAFVENPRYFTRRGGETEGAALTVNAGVTNRDLVQMEKFFEKHKDIAKQLRKNPVSGMDPSYLAHHKDLRRFFDEHAEIQVEFNHDPRYFMQRENEFQRQGNAQVANR